MCSVSFSDQNFQKFQLFCIFSQPKSEKVTPKGSYQDYLLQSPSAIFRFFPPMPNRPPQGLRDPCKTPETP